MKLRFISWNLKGGDPRQLALLDELMTDHCLVALQEVSPSFVSPLKESSTFDWMRCSFELRAPLKYDGRNRKLAVVVAGCGELKPGQHTLVPETLLPERTLAVTVDSPEGQFVACSFHALAGASFKHGKILMFRALTRWLEAQTLPIVFGVDRNTPKVDHPDEEHVEWWRPGETREPLMFGPDAPHGCRDAFRVYLEDHPDELAAIRSDRPRGPLEITFERGTNRVPCRYDAVHVSPGFSVRSVEHRYERDNNAGSDHGLVIADLELSSEPR